jgi:hypothetical protein
LNKYEVKRDDEARRENQKEMGQKIDSGNNVWVKLKLCANSFCNLM